MTRWLPASVNHRLFAESNATLACRHGLHGMLLLGLVETPRAFTAVSLIKRLLAVRDCRLGWPITKSAVTGMVWEKGCLKRRMRLLPASTTHRFPHLSTTAEVGV